MIQRRDQDGSEERVEEEEEEEELDDDTTDPFALSSRGGGSYPIKGSHISRHDHGGLMSQSRGQAKNQVDPQVAEVFNRLSQYISQSRSTLHSTFIELDRDSTGVIEA